MTSMLLQHAKAPMTNNELERESYFQLNSEKKYNSKEKPTINLVYKISLFNNIHFSNNNNITCILYYSFSFLSLNNKEHSYATHTETTPTFFESRILPSLTLVNPFPLYNYGFSCFWCLHGITINNKTMGGVFCFLYKLAFLDFFKNYETLPVLWINIFHFSFMFSFKSRLKGGGLVPSARGS